MKKIVLFILIISILSLAFSEITNDKSIPVNAYLKKHIELEVSDESMSSWFWNFNNTKNSVTELDPEEREGYFEEKGLRINIKTNTKVNLVSYFLVNEEITDISFYNNDEKGSVTTNYGSIEGGVAIIEDGNMSGSYPLCIIGGEDINNDPTTIPLEFFNGQEITIDYNMQIKFSENNWWKIPAGNHTLGWLSLIIEPNEDF